MSGSLFPSDKIDLDCKFQTPVEVCEYMASLIPDTAINVLEPTPGYGNIVRAIACLVKICN